MGASQFQVVRKEETKSQGSDQAYEEDDGEIQSQEGDVYDKDSLEAEEQKEYELRKSIVEKTHF